MIRVIKTSFSATKETIDLLFTCNRISAQIWNESLRIAKEYALANNGDWINQSKVVQSFEKALSYALSKCSVCCKTLSLCS